ncbi:MAG: SHOCT domain-containing protein [Thermoproteota archaeon]|nr:SHOCT domain-containing protein [Thermoproteota archaeon]
MSDQESNRMRRVVGWGIVGLIVIIGISIALSFYFAPRPLGAFHYPFFFPFHFGWLGAIFIIFIVALIARWFFWPWRGGRVGGEGYYSYPQQQRQDAASIVRERYAKGEITREQFEQMMRDLQQQGG